MNTIKKLEQPKPPLIRYITKILGIDLRDCLRIYRDTHKDGYWLVIADSEWKETKHYISELDRELLKVVSLACVYNSAVREFILKNTEGALS